MPSRAATTPERDVQAACLAILRGFGCVAHRRNTGAMSGAHKGKAWFVRFGEPGAADVWALMPDGRHLELEVKRPGQYPTLDQVHWLRTHNGIGSSVAFWVDNTATLERVYRRIIMGGRVVYRDDERTYPVKIDGKTRRVVGPTGDYDLA